MSIWIIALVILILIIIILRYTFGYIGLENRSWNLEGRIKERYNESVYSNRTDLSTIPFEDLTDEISESNSELIEPINSESFEESELETVEVESENEESENEESENEKSENEEFTKEELEDFYHCENPYIPHNCSIGEKECRRVLRKHFGYRFKSCRPHFLMNPNTWARLELDCYEGALRLACEFQGRQHYYFTKQFHSSHEDFEKQQERDRIKAELCRRLGIYLIRVPYSVKKADIEEYILERLPSEYKKFKKQKNNRK